MAVLAVIIPILMLGVVLAMGRYEELLLPHKDADRYEPAAARALPDAETARTPTV